MSAQIVELKDVCPFFVNTIARASESVDNIDSYFFKDAHDINKAQNDYQGGVFFASRPR